MDINGYLNEIRMLAASGQATEHSYRPALERLFKSINDNLTVINEPKQSAVGAPDFVFARNGVSVGWCEAKDLHKDITKFKTGDYGREQKERYKKGLPNLIYTNGTDFEFIVKGEVTGFVSIADLIPTLPARPQEFPRLEILLKDFASQTPISINTAKQLAEMMAGKAVIIKDIMGNALVADKDAGISTELTDQYEGFKISLIHDITIADFADIYAETIAYGLFAARLHDTNLDSFNRAEALELLPKSNPFLRNLFVYIAGPNLDDRLRRMIDDLCDVFRACDVSALMQDFGKFTARNDPFLHFYETFLAEYNPAKRKARGVWYTPEPVVNFIVRAVDDVLKTEFGLPMGLADTSKIPIEWDTGQNDAKGKPVMIKKDVHRVQILDPATGTGTFLAEAIKQIAAQVKDVAPAMWSSYVERDLIPRLHGFELLMASYAMCHMKLDMMLTDMGYKPSASPPRLGVYLTNSLEEGERVEQTLPFARWLSEEAKGANTIKRDTPIMCVIGNPPYNSSSQNMGAWIRNLIAPYKQGLNEKKINLDEDYIKFLRFSESLIEKNGSGIVGFITNNSYLRGVTHRQMRRHLMGTFNKIYILNLHGDSNQMEKNPNGGADKNVFDIKQGVSICLLVKKNTQSDFEDCVVRVHHVFGERAEKNEYLFSESVSGLEFEVVTPSSPYYFFDDASFSEIDQYETGFKVTDLFSIYNTGIQTKRDNVCLQDDEAGIREVIGIFRSEAAESIRTTFGLPSDNDGWSVERAKNDILNNQPKAVPVLYRPFDVKWTAYTGVSSGFLGRPRDSVMRQMIGGGNVALMCGRQNKSGELDHFLATALPSEMKCAERTIQSYHLPLYLYPEEGTLETERRVNFDPKIYADIRARAGLSSLTGGGGPAKLVEGQVEVVPRSKAQENPPAPLHHASHGPPPRAGEDLPDELLVFDYIYGVLHSPDYRRTYAQFLKIDFPRIPYPASPEVFAHIAEKGGQLRRLHLMEDAAIGATPYPFKGDGDNVVVKPAFSQTPPVEMPGGGAQQMGVSTALDTNGEESDPNQEGRVMINPDQYFENVPAVAWEFHIGGYQPAQKWLKDRKGRALSFDDVMHYQKIIKILTETDRIMKEIELPLYRHHPPLPFPPPPC